MKCTKCGAELHPDQKVCIECGARTVAGGGFDYGEEHKWQPSPKMIKIAAGAVAFVLLVFVAYKLLHVVPPETVAREWFDAMLQGQTKAAQRYITPKVEQDLQGRMTSLHDLSMEYRSDESQGTYTATPPVYSDANGTTVAEVTFSITFSSGQGGRDVRVQMVKVGRAWKINQIT